MANVFRVSGWAIDLDKIVCVSPVHGSKTYGYYFTIAFLGKHTIQTDNNLDQDVVMAERELLVAKWAGT